MRTRSIRHVDAFTTTPLEGNPAAVVDGDGLSDDLMQRIALNQKLSETVFLLPPAADGHARLRIFTPAIEVPFAGHPTLAAAHTLLSEGRVSIAPGQALRLETGAGIVPVRVAGDPPRYTMTQAAPAFRPASASRSIIAGHIGLAEDEVVRAEDVSTGLWWTVAQLSSLEAMLRVRPDIWGIARDKLQLSIFCLGAQQEGVDMHVRAFAAAVGVPEDPVTGSANGCIAAYIAREGLLKPRDGAIEYVVEQGIEMGQPGLVYARVTASGGGPLAGREDIQAHIGGYAVTVLRGELSLPD